jgi:hypothetical protein
MPGRFVKEAGDGGHDGVGLKLRLVDSEKNQLSQACYRIGTTQMTRGKYPLISLGYALHNEANFDCRATDIRHQQRAHPAAVKRCKKEASDSRN